VSLSVVRDPGNAMPAVFAFLLALCAPIVFFMDRGGFEARRWSLSSEG
jgi:hypothetical protein